MSDGGASVNVKALTAGYDDAPDDDYGYVNKPVPRGRYPMKFSKLVDTRMTRNGVPEAVFRVEVTEGPHKGEGYLDSLYLGASRTKAVMDDNKNVVRDGNGQVQRVEVTEEEFAKKMRGAQGRIKTLRTKVLGLPAKATTTAPDTDPAYIFQFYGVPDLLGREYMAEVMVDKDGRNNTLNRFPVDHEEWGLAKWRAVELPKQMRAAGGVAVSNKGAQEI